MPNYHFLDKYLQLLWDIFTVYVGWFRDAKTAKKSIYKKSKLRQCCVEPTIFYQKTVCCLRNLSNKFGDPGNDKLATLRYDFKRLTSITSRPNIALNAVKF